MSNVILEAMSSGLLVFSTNVGDVKYVIKNGINGFIFSSHDSSKICTEFVDIIQNKENNFHSIKKKAYLAVNQKYSLKALDLRLNELYKQINIYNEYSIHRKQKQKKIKQSNMFRYFIYSA